ncbi:MAG: DUF1016 family protein [Saprospiraceae bacterium]|jgi:predicted nuclease of restriction endonuclease-like (RecB) superfamily|nr:DUF1016 family protein [Saprospiraceae bacterium]
MDFSKLVNSIKQSNDFLQQRVVKAINTHLILRNWLIGFYIVAFEQDGNDRAQYGKKLISELSKAIQIKGLSETNLKLCRQFYNAYPQLFHTIITDEKSPMAIGQLLTDQLQVIDNRVFGISQSTTDESIIDENHLQKFIFSTSFTHLVELIKIEDETKRHFYELLILKTQPSVKELKRQIEALTYERVGLSENKTKSFQEVAKKIQPQESIDLVKSHYFFEFLNLSQSHLVEETELEQALIAHLQQFLTELGNGFCFEARQKRILIGDEYYFIDLVFYHRILKCHVLIELKTKAAKHENIGQLKAYLQHFKRNIQEENDNPPVGILLVTHQNKTLVEYAIADSDLDIFVSKYQLQLPDKSSLEAFINNELST